MTVPLFPVERQQVVSVLSRLDRIAEERMGRHSGGMPGDQEIRIRIGLGSVHYLRDPAKRLSRPSPVVYVSEEPPEYRHQGIIAPKRVRQRQCSMQTVPHLLRRPASKRDPGGTQQGAHIQ